MSAQEKTYKLKLKRGAIGDMVTDYMTPEELAAFWEDHKELVENLKAKGKHLEEYETTFIVKDCEMFDPGSNVPATTSYRFVVLDIKDEEE